MARPARKTAEEKLETRRAWRARNIEHCRAHDRARRPAGPPHIPPTPTCHPDRKHRAFGLCGPCYKKDYHKRNSEKRSAAAKQRYREDPHSKAKSAEAARRRRATPEGRLADREWRYRRKYGLTIAMRDAKFHEQNGACAICKRAVDLERIHVDHDHKTGAVRDLLCSMCNRGLGFFVDRADLCDEAAAYLRRHAKLGA